MAGERGPLAVLAGVWESDQGGLDAAFSHSITVDDDGGWSYDETTLLAHRPQPVAQGRLSAQ